MLLCKSNFHFEMSKQIWESRACTDSSFPFPRRTARFATKRERRRQIASTCYGKGQQRAHEYWSRWLVVRTSSFAALFVSLGGKVNWVELSHRHWLKDKKGPRPVLSIRDLNTISKCSSRKKKKPSGLHMHFKKYIFCQRKIIHWETIEFLIKKVGYSVKSWFLKLTMEVE